MKGNWPFVAIILFIIGCAVIVVLAIREQNRWETWCHDRGGTVSHHTDWITVSDGKGGTTSTSNTTYYCITEDGRLLSVR